MEALLTAVHVQTAATCWHVWLLLTGVASQGGAGQSVPALCVLCCAVLCCAVLCWPEGCRCAVLCVCVCVCVSILLLCLAGAQPVVRHPGGPHNHHNRFYRQGDCAIIHQQRVYEDIAALLTAHNMLCASLARFLPTGNSSLSASCRHPSAQHGIKWFHVLLPV
jgi:hypothetical protein